VSLQPAGIHLNEDYHHAGGVPAVDNQLMKYGPIREGALTTNGRTIGDNSRNRDIIDTDVIRPFETPLQKSAGFPVMRGNIFNAAITKTRLSSDEFRQWYLSNPSDPKASEGHAVVFDGQEDYHTRIDDPAATVDCPGC
jgi:dihydroxy-acid dehydratase